MKIRGKNCRMVKKPSKCFFNRQWPQCLARPLEEREDGDHKYKQTISRKKGKGKFPRGSKF